MTVYPANEYKFVRFERSKVAGKKYAAVLLNKKTGREVRINFGARGYSQFKDRAAGLYSSGDHKDPKRRASYRARHRGEGDASKKYSAGWFAFHYLW